MLMLSIKQEQSVEWQTSVVGPELFNMLKNDLHRELENTIIKFTENTKISEKANSSKD